MTADNIMLDLETYDTIVSAVVLSIGAVRFDSHSCYERSYISFGTVGSREDQLAHGRTQSDETIAWWVNQTPEARKVLWDPESIMTREALEIFAKFCGRGAIVWGNGSDFDNTILGSLYVTYGMKVPWHHKANRCFRTLKSLAPKIAPPTRAGVHHNALDDAVHQALWAQLMLQHLAIEL